MSKTVRVKIGGLEYNLRSDNEQKVRFVADAVDRKMSHLQHSIGDQSTTTLAVLTALNIAEQHYELQEKGNKEMDYITAELNKMNQYMMSIVSSDDDINT